MVVYEGIPLDYKCQTNDYSEYKFPVYVRDNIRVYLCIIV